VLAMNRSEILEAFFAVSKLTAILVPLNYRLTQSELQYIIEDCEPSVLLYESEFASTAQSLCEQLSIQNSLSFDGPEENYEQALTAAGVAAIEEELTLKCPRSLFTHQGPPADLKTHCYRTEC